MTDPTLTRSTAVASSRSSTAPRLLAVHTAVPSHRMSQDASLQLAQDIICRDARDKRLMRVLFRKATVENRYTCVPHEVAYEWAERDQGISKGPTTGERMALYALHAPPLAREAAAGAIADAGLLPEDITHLVIVSCTGFSAPGVDISLIQSLGLPATTQRVQVGYMGCHGAINGLRTAQGLAAQPNARVLMVAVELCSLHYRFDWDDEAVVGNSLFGDGCAAVVLGSHEAPRDTPLDVALEDVDPELRITATGSCLLPNSLEAMSWNVGDFGFEMRLTQEVPAAIERHLRDWMSEWLMEHGLSLSEVGQWLIHPGGPKILEAAEHALGLDTGHTEFSRQILREYGNMSSPTLLFVLERALHHSPARPVVMLAFGPGLVAEAALLE